MYIPIILGTGREGRGSEKVAHFMLQATEALEGVETKILDVRDFRIEATTKNPEDESVKKYSEEMTRADGLIVIAPEYNHSYPGSLKMMLDMAYKEYWRKPMGICGVSAGGLGGVRMVEQLRLVAIELHMVPIREAMYFSGVWNLFDEEGNITETAYEDRVKTFHEELIWYTAALKHARETGLEHLLCSPPGD